MKKRPVSLVFLLAAMMAFSACTSSGKPAGTAGSKPENTLPVQESTLQADTLQETLSTAAEDSPEAFSDWEDDLLMPEDTPTWEAEYDTEEADQEESSSETEESTDMTEEISSAAEESTDLKEGISSAAGKSSGPAEEGSTAGPEAEQAAESASGMSLPAEDELAWEDETFGPQVLDDAGRARVYDLNDNVSAWIPIPKGYYADETFSNRNALVLYPVDTDTLNADAAYYVYDTEDGYLDFNMDDPLTEEALMVADDEDLSLDGPSDIVTFQVGSREMMGASLFVSYVPEDGAPVYTTRYLIWTHLDERTIVTCLVGAASANPEPLLTMEEAGRMFLSPVSLK